MHCIWQVYEALSKVPNGKFTVAAAFGNVHGVYSPGNVRGPRGVFPGGRRGSPSASSDGARPRDGWIRF